MNDISRIKDLILELEKQKYLTLNVDDYRLTILINRYLTGQDV